ncbi:hypothetical protein QJ854_gp939 [Moumouvirus goulette]|uniref:Uncharacterized protein n=1 Tax=Moumouvirus goulette TaxID=1247379 RepID=M1PFS1_9VIRU|nr:hypothetical protein QJ854_gp939 [Moumouvirus goulette]AGF84843.1 hypothetical protein glt_00034 [Moumouvirus goulette]
MKKLNACFKSKFNNNLRFKEGGVYYTFFPTKVYKKLKCVNNDSIFYNEAIATLKIPSGSIIIRPLNTFGEIRTNKIYVEKIEILDDNITNIDDYICQSPSYGDNIYKIGQNIKLIGPLNTSINEVHTSGIHCFLYKEQALKYKLEGYM